MQQPSLGNESGDQKRGDGNAADRERLAEAEFDLIRLKAAKGLTLQDAADAALPGRILKGLKYAAYKSFRWSAWSGKEDVQVLALQREGNSWAEIRDKLAGTPRTREEVKARVEYLRDLLIKLAQARFIFGLSVIEARDAERIGAIWSPDDDDHLREKILQGGGIDGWDSIGDDYDPPRDGEIVKTCWDFLERQQ